MSKLKSELNPSEHRPHHNWPLGLFLIHSLIPLWVLSQIGSLLDISQCHLQWDAIRPCLFVDLPLIPLFRLIDEGSITRPHAPIIVAFASFILGGLMYAGMGLYLVSWMRRHKNIRNIQRILILSIVFLGLLITAAAFAFRSPNLVFTGDRIGKEFSPRTYMKVTIQNSSLFPVYYYCENPEYPWFRRITHTNTGWMENISWGCGTGLRSFRISPGSSTNVLFPTFAPDSSFISKVGLKYYRYACTPDGDYCQYPLPVIQWILYRLGGTAWSEPLHIEYPPRRPWVETLYFVIEKTGFIGIARRRLSDDALVDLLHGLSIRPKDHHSAIQIVVRKGTPSETVQHYVNQFISAGLTNIPIKTIDAPLEDDDD